jgi:Na+/proline symporter
MHPLDWLVIAGYLIWMVYDGLKRTKASDQIEGYFLANRSLPWWAVGLSVMATPLSAITLVGTTGQGDADGMRFFSSIRASIAMIVLSATLVPFFHRAESTPRTIPGAAVRRGRGADSFLFLARAACRWAWCFRTRCPPVVLV